MVLHFSSLLRLRRSTGDSWNQLLVHLHRCCSVGPGWKRVQIKHHATPAVSGQSDAADADNVHYNSCFSLWRSSKRVIMDSGWLCCPAPTGAKAHHVWHFEVAVGEDNGIGGCGHRQHEGEGCAERAGDHHIQRVQADRLRLDQDKEEHLSVNVWY